MDTSSERLDEYKQSVRQEFKVKRSYIISIKITAAIFFALLLLSPTIPFWPFDAENKSVSYLMSVLLSGCSIFVLVMMCIEYWQSKHANITTDEDGLWYTHLGKESGLVPWNNIFRFWIEQGYTDVLDYDGNKLIRISDSLKDRNILGKWLFEMAEDNIAVREAADTRTTRDFSVEKKVIRKTRLYFFGLIFVCIPAIFFLIFNELHKANLSGYSVTSIVFLFIIFLCVRGIFVALFLFGAIHFGKKSFCLSHAAIMLDEDGIWQKDKSKDLGLVPWERIYKLKERRLRQCMDIRDFNGSLAIRAEYELKDYAILRNRLLDKVEHNYNETLSDCFSKGNMHHLIYTCLLAVILSAGSYGASLDPENSLLFYIASLICAGILITMYLFSRYRIIVHSNKLVFVSPIRKTTINFADIKSIEFSDGYEQGIRGSNVLLTTYDDNALILSSYACVDAHVLYLSLKKAVKKYQANFDDKHEAVQE